MMREREKTVKGGRCNNGIKKWSERERAGVMRREREREAEEREWRRDFVGNVVRRERFLRKNIMCKCDVAVRFCYSNGCFYMCVVDIFTLIM